MQPAGMAPVIMARSLRLRCPRCGKGAFLKSFFKVNDTCNVCGMRFQREEGFYVGAIYANLIATQFLVIGGLFALMFLTDFSLITMIVILAGVAGLFPVVFYPFSLAIWLGMNHFFTDKPQTNAPPEGKQPQS